LAGAFFARAFDDRLVVALAFGRFFTRPLSTAVVASVKARQSAEAFPTLGASGIIRT
jgi:hypothetical protein